MPEFVDLQQNAEDRTVLLSVRDANVKQQKEMWGKQIPFLVLGFFFFPFPLYCCTMHGLGIGWFLFFGCRSCLLEMLACMRGLPPLPPPLDGGLCC